MVDSTTNKVITDTELMYQDNVKEYNELMKELDHLFEDETTEGSGGGNDDTDTSGDQQDDDTTGGASGSGSGQEMESDDNDSNAQPTEELSDRQKEQLAKATAKQKEFVNGDVKKTNLSKKDKKMLDVIESSDASIEQVPGDWGGSHEVTVIRKINEHNRGVCDMYTEHTGWGIRKEVIADGFRLGTMLGKKLRVRNDDITTQYNRQRKGSLDRRLLADLGVGNTKIFEKSYTTTANDAGIHISIDASGSMGGDRFRNAITTAIAIAKAADMVGGIRVRIDLRSDCSSIIGRNKGWGNPTVLIAYDSKVNNMLHIKKNFLHLSCGGGTPEGLCFQAIKDIITEGGRDTDRYFINMSDGLPNSACIEPTTKAVRDFKRSGLKVMSYFIGSLGTGFRYGSTEHIKDTFERMYGKESTQYIDTTNITQIAKTLNEMLSERG